MTARRGWFRLDSSILRQDWPDDVLLIYMRLTGYLIDRWAREGRTPEEAGTARINSRDLMVITGCQRPHSARARLSKAATSIGLVTHYEASSVLVEWPKFAEIQGLTARTRPLAYADAYAPPYSPPTGGTERPRKGRRGKAQRAADQVKDELDELRRKRAEEAS